MCSCKVFWSLVCSVGVVFMFSVEFMLLAVDEGTEGGDG